VVGFIANKIPGVRTLIAQVRTQMSRGILS